EPVTRVSIRLVEPRSEPVAARQEPVAETAEEIGWVRCAGDGLERLGHIEDGDAVARLREQADGPPDRDGRGERGDAGGRPERGARGRATSRDREQQPERGRDADEEQ